MHPKFDNSLFQLFEREGIDGIDFDSICSPFNLWSDMKIRSEFESEFVDFDQVKIDLFLWGLGEPQELFLTKMGGRPVWEKGKPLPSSELGYVGQLCFVDSSDLFTLSSGSDLVSIWGDHLFPYGEIQAFPLSSRNCRYLDEERSHSFLEGRPTFHGAVYRYCEFDVGEQDFDPVEIVSGGRFQYYSPGILPATKIGGHGESIECMARGFQFYGQICSIQAKPEVPFPWINSEKPLPLTNIDGNGYSSQSNSLVFGDMGKISIYGNPESGEMKAGLAVE